MNNNLALGSSIEIFKEMIAAKTLVQLLDEARAIIRSRPFWGFSDDDLNNVRIPINFKPKTETEIAIPVYYLHSQYNDCGLYQWFANRRNLDGHLAVFEEIEDSTGRIYSCDDLKKDPGHLTVSGPDYKAGVYFIGLDIFNKTRKLKFGYYNAGVEVIDLANFYPDIFSLFSTLSIPAFRFVNDIDSMGYVLSLSYDYGSYGSAILAQARKLPPADCFMPIFRRLDADEY